MDPEVANYIKEARQQGLADEQIKQNLITVGHDGQAVSEAFVAAGPRADDPALVAGPPTIAVNTSANPPSSLAGSAMPSPIVVSDADFNRKPRKKLPLLIGLGIFVLLILAGAGYYAYATFYNNPTKVWQQFTANSGDTIFQNSFSFSYSDPNQLSPQDQQTMGFILKDIKLSLTGSSYFDLADPKKPQSSSDIQYTFSSGDTSFSTGFDYKFINNILYLNVGNNPLLNIFTQSLVQNGQKPDWIKIDLNKLQQTSQSQAQASQLQEMLDPSFKQELQQIWANAKIIKVDSYVGRETVSGVSTMHFKNSVDTAAVDATLNQYVDALVKKINSTSTVVSQSDIATAKTVMAAIIKKVQIKDLETWVGVSDAKLYRVKVITNAPSVISLIKNAHGLSSLNTGSNDAKRLADVRQMASGLELYFNDHNGYPEAKSGVPVGMTPTYIGVMPTAPPASGSCADYYNTYWYTPMGTKTVAKDGTSVYSSYQLTFCLGSAAGGYTAGTAELTPSGIQNIPCPGSPSQCTQTNPNTDNSVSKQINDFVSKLDFTAEIDVDSSYSGYGKVVPVDVPANALDLNQAMKPSPVMQSSPSYAPVSSAPTK